MLRRSRPPLARRLWRLMIRIAALCMCAALYVVPIMLLVPSPRTRAAAEETAQSTQPSATAATSTTTVMTPTPTTTTTSSFALVLVTSTEGSNRNDERLRVASALCSGDNARLLALHGFSIYVSIDGMTPLVQELPCAVKEHWHHARLDSSDAALRIAHHYGFLLKRAFDHKQHSHVIVLEDDLVPAADFMSLFVPGSPAFSALENDADVWCISAWHDVGVRTFASDSTRLLLTDIFPGLGWMASRKLWARVGAAWPLHATTGWDNWLRANNEHNSACVFPEVGRVKHISKSGSTVHNPAPYERLAFQGNDARPGPFQFPAGGSDGVVADYAAFLRAGIASSGRQTTFPELPAVSIGPVTVFYKRKDLSMLYAALGDAPPMNAEPRSSFRGVTTLRRQGHLLFLVDDVACKWAPVSQAPSRVVAGARGQSCDAVCAAQGRACSDDALHRMASPIGSMCRTMRTLFACEAGCGHQVGQELPAYSVAPDTAGQCLVSDSAVSVCAASHASTSRACACV